MDEGTCGNIWNISIDFEVNGVHVPSDDPWYLLERVEIGHQDWDGSRDNGLIQREHLT